MTCALVERVREAIDFEDRQLTGDIMGAIIENITGDSLGSVARTNFKVLATKAILPLLSAVALAGCAIHPVQQDVTGLKTVQVVDRIRCETRRAVQDKAIDLLYNLSDDPNDPSKRLAEYLRDHRERFFTIRRSDLPTKKERDFYDRYINTAIALEFSFDITESNGIAANADPLRLITGGTAGVAIGGSDVNARNNIRRFTIAEKFGDLLANAKLPCIEGYYPDNFIYPIAGSVGMQELISTFIDLNEEKDLSPVSKDVPRVFGDTLKFTTTLLGSVTPHVVIAPLGNRWGVASPTNVNLGGGRTDIHTLTIGLSIGAPPTGPAFVRRNLSGGVFPALSSRSGGSNKDRALQAIDDQHLTNFYDRSAIFR